MQNKHRGLTRSTLIKSAVVAAPAWQAVRWWWSADKLTEKEILRELGLLHTAGIGGVEVNPIRFPNPDDPLGLLTEGRVSNPRRDREGAFFPVPSRLEGNTRLPCSAAFQAAMPAFKRASGVCTFLGFRHEESSGLLPKIPVT